MNCQKRCQMIDIVRGTALAGVCFVNAETLFRISLLQHIAQPHTNAGQLNYLVDDFLTNFVEFKAVAVFSFYSAWALAFSLIENTQA